MRNKDFVCRKVRESYTMDYLNDGKLYIYHALAVHRTVSEDFCQVREEKLTLGEVFVRVSEVCCSDSEGNVSFSEKCIAASEVICPYFTRGKGSNAK